MLDKDIREKIVKIMGLGLEVNSREKNTVFVNFSGHCDFLGVEIDYDGYDERNKGKNLKKLLGLNLESDVKELDVIIEELERLRTI
ncbi:hypothetical protein [Fusobacterium nucleatum]|uniref:Uncharacterized protein n=1 Tax=Fusobacterium nucleatum TaxID=851 RepID=A0A133NQS9_FUSNU|nr:hypothetical protein [Fusobacterium nucleatum]KXA18649.1 hypothetical protein HMPREF3221_01700 [Fusobacterium nucleatum]